MVLIFELPICKKALGKKFCFAMWSLWRAAVVRRKYRPGIAGFRPGRVGEWSRAHPRSGSLVGRGQGCSGEWPRRCRSAPAVRLPAPASARPRRGSGRLGQLPRRLRGGGRSTLARGRPEIGVRRGWPKGAGGRLGAAGRAGARRGQGQWLLNRRRADPLWTCGRTEGTSGTRACQDDGGRTAGP
jgi:hypothetical protein